MADARYQGTRRRPLQFSAACIRAEGLARDRGGRACRVRERHSRREYFDRIPPPIGVNSLRKAMYGVHLAVFWICVGIAVVVFSTMIYTLLKFRRSQAAIPDTAMAHGTKAEIIWTIIPILILVVFAIPAADLILKQEDTRNSELSIRVTGYQWKWQYQYMNAGEGIGYFSAPKQDSNLARQLRSGIEPTSVDNLLLDVDKPLVIPSDTEVRLLLTSMDVIHAWWVPDFGAQRLAIPGFVNELWFKVDAGKEGIYRGQCAVLCGRDHGSMPVVVDVRSPHEFKKWVEAQKAAMMQATAPTAADAPLGAPSAALAHAHPTAQFQPWGSWEKRP